MYKAMNNGIREFFQLLNSNNLGIDQGLDIMDYVEEGDRAYKEEYIQSLQQVHAKFLVRKQTHHNRPKQQVPQEKQVTNQSAVSSKQASQSAGQATPQQSQGQAHPKTTKKDGAHKPLSLDKFEPKLHYLKQKRLTLNRNGSSKADADKSDKNAKAVSELQSYINTINGALQLQRDIELITSNNYGNLTELQEALSHAVDMPVDAGQQLAVDGSFGANTEEEVKKLQDKLNIETDGVVTESLVNKMDVLLKKINLKNSF